METTNAAPPTGAKAREDFDGRELAMIAETQASAIAAQAQASVQARYLMALKRPRDLDQVRIELLNECGRPGFAQVARYRKPIGKGIEGLSVRFAEAAVRCMRNILTETQTIYDDERKRIVRVLVTDLEANVPYSRDVTIDKVVERSFVKEGQRILSERLNSQGKKTYLVQATEDDLLNKEGALVSKAFRTLALRIIPGDLKDEAERLCIETLEKGVEKDPGAERKRLADAFAGINVAPAALKEFLGHDLGTCSPAELVELRAIYAAIRDGEATWSETLATKGEREKPAPAPAKDVEGKVAEKPDPPAEAPKAKTASELKDEARAKAAAQEKKA